ncbi:YraN family protein [Undibacterium sp. Ji49W]|uniref:YraN family protein n=1 Tax=Undibacterium sp. Ji49W TaxID=3413040 RepID=UPI003BF2EFDD
MRPTLTAEDKAGQQQDDRRTSRRRSGDEAENQALLYLQKAGLKLVMQNFSCKGGEIDLIMQDGATLVFVEVRKRSSMQFGGAVASVTPAKQRRMVHAAQVYLLSKKSQAACRFDLIAIDGDSLNWLKNIIVA